MKLEPQDLGDLFPVDSGLVGSTARFCVLVGGTVVGDRLVGGTLRAITKAELAEIFAPADLLPEIPEDGTYTLKAVDGVLTWVEDA